MAGRATPHLPITHGPSDVRSGSYRTWAPIAWISTFGELVVIKNRKANIAEILADVLAFPSGVFRVRHVADAAYVKSLAWRVIGRGRPANKGFNGLDVRGLGQGLLFAHQEIFQRAANLLFHGRPPYWVLLAVKEGVGDVRAMARDTIQ